MLGLARQSCVVSVPPLHSEDVGLSGTTKDPIRAVSQSCFLIIRGVLLSHIKETSLDGDDVLLSPAEI